MNVPSRSKSSAPPRRPTKPALHPTHLWFLSPSHRGRRGGMEVWGTGLASVSGSQIAVGSSLSQARMQCRPRRRVYMHYKQACSPHAHTHMQCSAAPTSEINAQTGQSLVPSHADAAAFVQKCKRKLKICGGAIFMNRNLYT